MKTKSIYSQNLVRFSKYLSFAIIIGTLIGLLVSLVVRYIPFHRDIIVMDKFCGASSSKYIIDDKGRVYELADSKMLGFFKSAEVFESLTIGKRYTVSGRGVRVPFFDLFPSITKVRTI